MYNIVIVIHIEAVFSFSALGLFVFKRIKRTARVSPLTKLITIAQTSVIDPYAVISTREIFPRIKAS